MDKEESYHYDISDVKSDTSEIDKKREKKSSSIGINYPLLIGFILIFLIFVGILFYFTAPKDKKEQLIRSAEELTNNTGQAHINIKGLGKPKLELISASVASSNKDYIETLKLRVRTYKGYGSVDLSKSLVILEYKNFSFTLNYSGNNQPIAGKSFGVEIVKDPTESFSHETPYVHEKGLAELIISFKDQEYNISPKSSLRITIVSDKESMPESYVIDMPISLTNNLVEIPYGQGISKIDLKNV